MCKGDIFDVSSPIHLDPFSLVKSYGRICVLCSDEQLMTERTNTTVRMYEEVIIKKCTAQ